MWLGFLRANHRLILSVIGFEIVAVGGSTALLLRSYGPEPVLTYGLGVLHMAMVAMIYHVLRVVFLANDQDAVHQLRGDFGESSTRDELKRAKRRRLIWGWVDSITVADGDIDHLVVTRGGGIVAIDSKWRSGTAHISDSALAAQRAARRASNVLRHLGYFKREHTARRRSEDAAIAVTPLVAVWGPIRDEVPDGARVEDVDFVAGPLLLKWLAAQRANPISRQAAKQLLGELEEFRRAHQAPDAVNGSRDASRRARTVKS